MVGELDRRDWMRLVAVLAAAGPAAAQTAQVTQATPPPKVTKEMLHNALQLIGLEFTEEQQAMMLPGVNRAINGYEGLRKIEVPLDTEPATRFYPTRPAIARQVFADAGKAQKLRFRRGARF